MKTAAVLSLLAASAAAFAPQGQQASTTALNAFEGEVGAQKPLGFWDPLNFVLDQDQERFDRLRYVELKHGRIAMMAVLGHVTTSSGIRLSGDIDYSGTSFASIKSGLAGISDIPTGGLVQIIAFIGFLEVFVMKDITGGEFPGDFRNGFLDFGWDRYSDEEKLEKRAIELNNGRAAQMGILGLMVHEKLTGDPYIINELFGYSSHFNAGL
mmetsp:Transcript_31056/g.44101  ORF Transcript_31056/g.44101 Transcript_31056/m.44101 type:complete len:211 (-) Transcript_31056:313-945(-)|eukprot:CAMPEP_0202441594 /NCGR_PEP_ID=MMETSP1360-20130828/1125_1 /ASSEMBLY_ACC=CAM_ASM_000848 /TAXON_ID=515479 /ORGANISM="Licmophora paradoxa, Strain CCMP2313" /LENGTH=210 /DNA_ID=CAMNT_0049056653 /DNA_START=13 /DNA_END=645 /DNA_ORIENTATION=+